MQNTKEKILTVSLELFAQKGYSAVSVRDISGKLGITQSALYKHYDNKQAIFNAIVSRMNERDLERAKEYSVPQAEFSEESEEYSASSAQLLAEFTKAEFRYWTQDCFAVNFRKMLTVEQYSNPTAEKLLQNYLTDGVLEYIKNIFNESDIVKGDSKLNSIEFFAPVYMLMQVYDNAQDKSAVTQLADKHIDKFFKEN